MWPLYVGRDLTFAKKKGSDQNKKIKYTDCLRNPNGERCAGHCHTAYNANGTNNFTGW